MSQSHAQPDTKVLVKAKLNVLVWLYLYCGVRFRIPGNLHTRAALWNQGRSIAVLTVHARRVPQ